MASNLLQCWLMRRAQELDEIANAHFQVGGAARGRRFATQQINHAYAMLLSSQFQGFCRDLHSEAVDHIIRSVTPVSLRHAAHGINRLPQAGPWESEYRQYRLRLQSSRAQIRAQSRRNNARISQLEELNRWRNAIAHQDFDPTTLGSVMPLRLGQVRRWRNACERLATAFDAVTGDHVRNITGTQPW